MPSHSPAEAARVGQLWHDVQELLDREAIVLDRLERLAARVRQAITANDVAELQSSVAASDLELAEQDRLEQLRHCRVVELGAALGVPEARLTLAGLAELAPPHERPALVAAREALLAAMTRLAEANYRNEGLLRGALRVTGESLTLLKELAGPRVGYTAGGRSRPVGEHGLVLDYQV